jgi:hypothetical protein
MLQNMTDEERRLYEAFIETKRIKTKTPDLDVPGLREDLRRLARNSQYAWEHEDEWRAQYPEQWVAVYKEHLVAVEATPEQARARLEELGIPLERAYLMYITKESYLLVL